MAVIYVRFEQVGVQLDRQENEPGSELVLKRLNAK